jgi:hypothetical protein
MLTEMSPCHLCAKWGMCGGSGIRTHGDGDTASTVFKTVAFGRSAIPPGIGTCSKSHTPVQEHATEPQLRALLRANVRRIRGLLPGEGPEVYGGVGHRDDHPFTAIICSRVAIRRK